MKIIKSILISLVVMQLMSCNQKAEVQNEEKAIALKLILSNSLAHRRIEFQKQIEAAKENIRVFSKKHNWENLTKEEFMDSIMIFDNKNHFDKTFLILSEMDTLTVLPASYCAALEKRTLTAMSPEYYAKIYPDGVEANSYEKLITHEIAHRLHIKILAGDEEAMGPIWFYEGFAIYVADQFSKSNLKLSKQEMIEIMQNPERGSYLKYNFIFRYFVEKMPLKELILKAKNKNFNEELILLIN